MKTICKQIAIAVMLLYSWQVSAQDQGFFLSDWQPKNISVASYLDAAKPAAAANATITADVNNVVTKVSRYLFGNNANPYMTQMVTEPVLI